LRRWDFFRHKGEKSGKAAKDIVGFADTLSLNFSLFSLLFSLNQALFKAQNRSIKQIFQRKSPLPLDISPQPII